MAGVRAALHSHNLVGNMFGAKPLVFRKLTPDEQTSPYPVSLTDEPRSPEPRGTESLPGWISGRCSIARTTPRHFRRQNP
jgi:hypothetical protein